MFFVTLLILFSNNKTIFSQGFDWQKGGRMPYNIPENYIGGNVSIANVYHNGDFNLKEDLIECCNFEDGNGYKTNVGLTYEYWLEDFTSIIASISYSQISGNFIIRSSLPTREGDFITDYGFESDISYINFIIGGKRRILGTHLHFGASIEFAVLLSGKSNYTEQAISNNVPFEKRTILTGKIEELNSVLIVPALSIGYDANLGVGYYATPFLEASYNLNSVIENESWRRLSIVIGLRLMRYL